MNYYISKSELYHFGIKGQKWGVRRFQNSDGSLTSAGKERYGSGLGNKIKEGAKAVGGRALRGAGKAAKLGASAAYVGTTSAVRLVSEAIGKVGATSLAGVGFGINALGEKINSKVLKAIGVAPMLVGTVKLERYDAKQRVGKDAMSKSKASFKKSAIGHEYYTRKGQKAYEQNQALINELKKRRPHYF